jgi:RNA polymerase-associated protein
MNAISIFEFKPFFMSDDISLVDCVVAPLLWRLSWLGIELPIQSKAIKLYATRLFLREAFRCSLSDIEEEMHVPSST